ncbi:MAG: hypothetical protein CM1200mP10_24110 [Candidatus Neomarinimicrobiota bacterium]|nr:MAG: hypothetical protein CM1200mP10_24110 [Candidatus Neomarinimicrobiota bacterium]
MAVTFTLTHLPAPSVCRPVAGCSCTGAMVLALTGYDCFQCCVCLPVFFPGPVSPIPGKDAQIRGLAQAVKFVMGFLEMAPALSFSANRSGLGLGCFHL